MRVAIVDDNAADRSWLEERVEALLARRGLEGTVFRRPAGTVHAGLPGHLYGGAGRRFHGGDATGL